MSKRQNRQQQSSRGSTLRCAALLVLLAGALISPPSLAADTGRPDTNAASEELLSVEQKSANTAAVIDQDNRDDLEPSTLALLALGLIALGLVRRKVRG